MKLLGVDQLWGSGHGEVPATGRTAKSGAKNDIGKRCQIKVWRGREGVQHVKLIIVRRDRRKT